MDGFYSARAATKATLHGLICHRPAHVAQSFSKDATGWVAKGVATLFDQYHSDRSAEDSINARRRMIEEGYWPGGPPPDGYRLTVAPNNPRRKIVVINEDRRSIVERIYTLCLHGDGYGPPLGIKAISKWLNDKGFRTRTGSRWGVVAIHRILTNSAYYGDYYWGLEPASSERRKPQPPALLRIPAIVSRSMHQEVQFLLAKRNPKMGAAKQTSSPLVLSGLAQCKCGASMTLGTGTGQQGKTYRYYVCSAANRGVNVCSAPRIPEETLDQIVLDTVRSRVLDHRHLTDLLVKLDARERNRRMAASEALPSLQARLTVAENAMEGLLASIRIAPNLANDPLFQRNLRMANEELTSARNRVTETVVQTADEEEVTEGAIEIFRLQMTELLDREHAARAKIYLSTIVERVEVGDRYIRIFGNIDDLKTGVTSSTPADDGFCGPGVRRYVE